MTLASQRARSGPSSSPRHLRSVSACSPSAPTSSLASSAAAPDAFAQTVADSFARYEGLIAATRAAAFDLGHALLRAQQDGGLSPIAGRQIFTALTASQTGIDTALTHSAEAHRLSSAVAKHLGIDPSAYGGQKPPEDPQPQRVFTGG